MRGAVVETPVLLVAFNRPEATEKNLENILRMRPRMLYVALDGPRADVPEDGPRCAAVRAAVEAVATRVPTRIDAAPENLGLRARVTQALDWVLSERSRVIVLEDDCHPDPSFFDFVEQMLDRYEDDQRVGQVCGSTAISLCRRGPAFEYDYHFSQVGLPWGWATWRRAWRDYERDMMSWPELRRTGLLERQIGHVAARQWVNMLDHCEEVQSWWLRWTVSHWAQARLSVVPRVSLVRNVGFSPDATHTGADTRYAQFAGMPVASLSAELKHPRFFPVDHELDHVTLEAALPYSAVKRGLGQLLIEGPLGLLHHLR